MVGNCILYWGLRSLNLLYAGCGVLFSLQSSDFYFGMQVCTGSVFELLQIICYYFFEGIRFVVAVVCLLCVSSIVLVCYCFFFLLLFSIADRDRYSVKNPVCHEFVRIFGWEAQPPAMYLEAHPRSS